MIPADKKPKSSADDWNECYAAGSTPWDSGLVERELRRLVEAEALPRGRTLELGCGTGTNAVYLAERGFEVTAVDFAAGAVAAAEARAARAGVRITFVCTDVSRLDALAEPFDFVFDRGCYHCLRREGALAGYLRTLERLTRPGSRVLLMAGNPDAAEQGGPPRVTAAELCHDFERRFRLERLAACRFEDAGGVEGPLAWSLLMTRR